GDARAVGVAGPPAATLGEEDDGEPPLARELEHAVLLPVVLQALRPGEDRIVVRHHHAAGAGRIEELPVHAADAGDETVRRRPLDQLLDRTPPALRRDHERAVLDERPGVAEMVDVLARR